MKAPPFKLSFFIWNGRKFEFDCPELISHHRLRYTTGEHVLRNWLLSFVWSKLQFNISLTSWTALRLKKLANSRFLLPFTETNVKSLLRSLCRMHLNSFFVLYVFITTTSKIISAAGKKVKINKWLSILQNVRCGRNFLPATPRQCKHI